MFEKAWVFFCLVITINFFKPDLEYFHNMQIAFFAR